MKNYGVGVGGFHVLELGREYDSISTKDLRPCVALVAFDGSRGAIAHFWTGAIGAEKVKSTITELKARMNPDTIQIALVGGLTIPNPTGTHQGVINTPEEMVATIKEALAKESMAIGFEDVFGYYCRAVKLRPTGIIEIAYTPSPSYGQKESVRFQFPSPALAKTTALPDNYKRRSATDIVSGNTAPAAPSNRKHL